MGKLNDKVALVTGSTSGIGRACAEKFATEGAKVIISGRNAAKGLETEEKLTNQGYQARYISCDITKEYDVKNLVEETISIYGKLDILMNNAGTLFPSVELERLEFEDWGKTFDTNVHGYFFTTKYAKKYLVESKGIILNNSSIAGLQSYASGRTYAYSASKAAVIQLSHMMAKNYAEYGIRVNCICPGIIETPILGERDRKTYEERIPLRRIGNPEDVAKVALFLVSEDSSYLTGVVLPVDGGVSL